MNHSLIAVAAAAALFSTSAFAAPSAKFAATYGYGPSLTSSVNVTTESDPGMAFDLNAGYTLATIKVPQDKELMVGVSAEIGIVTDTSIKGKNGGAAKALAGAGAGVVVFAVPVDGHGTPALAEPGLVVLSKRVQVLNATLGGVIEDCTFDSEAGTIDVATQCNVSDEEIGLMIDTMASHHFNFVLPDMDQGEYALVAFFVTGAFAKVDDLTVIDGGTVTATAGATALIGKHMVTVQQVRAVKDSLEPLEIQELW